MTVPIGRSFLMASSASVHQKDEDVEGEAEKSRSQDLLEDVTPYERDASDPHGVRWYGGRGRKATQRVTEIVVWGTRRSGILDVSGGSRFKGP